LCLQQLLKTVRTHTPHRRALSCNRNACHSLVTCKNTPNVLLPHLHHAAQPPAVHRPGWPLLHCLPFTLGQLGRLVLAGHHPAGMLQSKVTCRKGRTEKTQSTSMKPACP
jgi:hypothetical protein